jgi:hypothetical protein
MQYKRMESAALRAKNPMFCPVGAMVRWAVCLRWCSVGAHGSPCSQYCIVVQAFMLFKRWDVDRHPIPDFGSRGAWCAARW